MKKIVIIGANSFQNPLIEKAKLMGFETHVFAWKDGSIGEKTADYFYPISIVDKEKILDVCKSIKPDAVATIASDLANVTVQYLCKHLGLPCNSDECIEATTNKYVMRNILHENGVSVPKFTVISSRNEVTDDCFINFKFPCIVKPTDRSGSRGIYKVNNIEDIKNVIENSISLSLEKKAIVEEFIEGEEYSCESISFQGVHTQLAITKKFTTGSPHFIETGHIEPATLNDLIRNKINESISLALSALKISSGPSHAEFKIDKDGNIRIIEIGSRMGGDCIGSHLVCLSTGFDYLRMTIETALGLKPTFERINLPRHVAIRFIFNRKDYDLYKQAKSAGLVYFYSGLENDFEDEVVDSSSRKGYFIMVNDDEGVLNQWMKK